MWDTLLHCLGGAGPEGAQDARCIAFLPATLGGLGLQSATRGAVAAYWVVWADALPVIHARRPELADACVAPERPDEAAGCLGRAATARAMLLMESCTVATACGPSPQPPSIALLAVGTASRCLADSRAERASVDATARHHANYTAPAVAPPVALGPTALRGGWHPWL